MTPPIRVEHYQLGQHAYLRPEDACYHWFEYTSGGGYSTPGNSMIHNLKKEPNKPQAELRYKAKAINEVAGLLANSIGDTSDLLFLPVPPSKAPTDPLYDDRMVRILRRAQAVRADAGEQPLEYAELLTQRQTRTAMHASGDNRPGISELASGFEVAEELIPEAPKTYVIFDDLLVAGTTFRAVQQRLTPYIARGSKFVGLFVARRATEDDGLPARLRFAVA